MYIPNTLETEKRYPRDMELENTESTSVHDKAGGTRSNKEEGKGNGKESVCLIRFDVGAPVQEPLLKSFSQRAYGKCLPFTYNYKLQITLAVK